MSTSVELTTYDNYIDGASVEPASGKYLPTENPFTGETWARIARSDARDVEKAVTAARNAFDAGPWPEYTATQRGHMLWNLGELVIANAARLAEIEQRDNGKLASEVTAQVRYVATTSSTTRDLRIRSRAR